MCRLDSKGQLVTSSCLSDLHNQAQPASACRLAACLRGFVAKKRADHLFQPRQVIAEEMWSFTR